MPLKWGFVKCSSIEKIVALFFLAHLSIISVEGDLMAEKKKSGKNQGNYVVGKYKPPVETRFEPGRSGNPKGKPRGTLSLKSLLKRELEKEVKNGENPVTVAQALMNDLVKYAHKGNMKAMEMILDRIDGKILQEFNFQGDMSVNLFSSRRKAPRNGGK